MYRLLFALLSSVLIAAAAPAPVLPSCDKILDSVELLGIEGELVQIPATVIDDGMLKGVPYVSYRVGADCEINVYGDPDSPGCIEIGVYKSLLADSEAKQRCVNFIKTLMPEMPLGMLRLTGGKVLKSGVVGEVTLPDAPDAYGGWWVTVYNQSLLHGLNGTTNTFTVQAVPSESTAARSAWGASAWKYARPGRSVWLSSFIRRSGASVQGYSRKGGKR